MAGSDRCSGRSPITTLRLHDLGRRLGFWGYGYPDIYAGIFGPYGYDDLSAYLPQRPQDGARRAASRWISFAATTAAKSSVCRSTRSPPRCSRPRRKAQASTNSATPRSRRPQMIRASCPSQVAATAPGRLAAMQQRIEAMEKPSISFSPPLDKFYGSLTTSRRRASMRWPRISVVRQLPATPGDRWSRIARRLLLSIGRASDIEARLHPERHSARRATGAPGYQRRGRAIAQGGLRAERRDDAAGADGRGPQAARHDARGVK